MSDATDRALGSVIIPFPGPRTAAYAAGALPTIPPQNATAAVVAGDAVGLSVVRLERSMERLRRAMRDDMPRLREQIARSWD